MWKPISEFDYPTDYGDEFKEFLFFDGSNIYIAYCNYCLPEIGTMDFISNEWTIRPTHFMELPDAPKI